MKKILFILIAVLFSVLLISGSVLVMAEETGTVEQQAENVASESKIDEMSQWLSENLNKETIYRIVQWCIDGCIGIGLIVVLIKYYTTKKTKEEDIESIASRVVNTILEGKNETEKKEIQENIGEIKTAIDTIVKALVLMQDSSSKGKVALLELLNVAKDGNISKVVEETKEIIESKIKEENVVKEAVQEEYKDIF